MKDEDKSYDRDILKQYAKRYYLTVNEDGKRRYTLEQITAKIKKKFKKDLDKSTISIWARKDNWNASFDDIKTLAIQKLTGKEIDDVEQTILEIKANEKAEFVKMFKELANGFSTEIQRRIRSKEIGETPLRDLIVGLEKSFLAIANHLGFEDSKSMIHKTIDSNGNVTGIDFSGMSEDELKKLAGEI